MSDYSSSQTVAYWSEKTGDLTLADRLAWIDVLRRNLKAGRRQLSILDAGTGTGFMAHFLTELRHNVTGVDQSEAMLAVARERTVTGKGKGSVTFLPGDVTQLAPEDGQYDAIVARYVLSELADPAAALGRWFSLLNDNGVLFIVEDDGSDAENLANKQRIEKVNGVAGKWSGVAAEPIAAAVAEAGFHNIRVGKLAGQLMQNGQRLWQKYSLPYLTVRAEKPPAGISLDVVN